MTAPQVRLSLHAFVFVALSFLAVAESSFAQSVREQQQEIMRVGARAMNWLEKVQSEAPVDFREQLWLARGLSTRGASAQKPQFNRSDSATEFLERGLSQLPPPVAQKIQSRDPLPEALPGGLIVKDVIEGFRSLHTAYGLASRWLGLYPSRNEMSKASSDLRPWMALNWSFGAFLDEADDWARLNPAQKFHWLEKVQGACGVSLSPDICQKRRVAVATKNLKSAALEWVQEVWSRGRMTYESRFQIQEPRWGTGVFASATGELVLEIPVAALDERLFGWFQNQVREAWSVVGELDIHLVRAGPSFRSVLEVFRLPGALPHVDQVGGSRLMLDANNSLWTEHSKRIVAHEFGHVLGFPDCYVEFWDPDEQAFVYYELDPTNRMCSLSGEMQDQHMTAIVGAYLRF